MNCLSGNFQLNGIQTAKNVRDPNHFENATLSLKLSRINVFDSSGQSYFYHRDTGVLCAIIGYLSNIVEVKRVFGITENDDAKLIHALYVSRGFSELYHAMDGVFTAVLYDEGSQEGYIFQDKNASNLPLYYALQKNEAAFSTSLKVLLSNLSITRELNIQGAYDFLFYRYLFNANMIPNDQTLIKNVNKLVTNTYLYFNRKQNKAEVKYLKHCCLRSKNNTYGLRASIDASVRTLYRSLKEKKVYAALSSGFDTNYLTYALQKLSQNPITVLTVGGRDKNEVPVSEAIVKSYPHLVHVTSTLGSNVLDYFPDMVWKLEGYAFDVSSFLQYELARLLKERGAKAVFVGDGADQILDFSLYALQTKVKKQFLLNLLAKFYHNCFSKKPWKGMKVFKPFFYLREKASSNVSCYAMLDYILKNGGLLLNANNIQGIYPYLENDVSISAYKLGVLNFQKRWYKRQIKKELPENVVRYLVKSGGHTDIEYIFNEKKEALLNKINKSDILHDLLPKSLLDVIIGDSQTHMYFILLLLYLCVFQELFISGRFDGLFDTQDLNIQLDAFL